MYLPKVSGNGKAWEESHEGFWKIRYSNFAHNRAPKIRYCLIPNQQQMMDQKQFMIHKRAEIVELAKSLSKYLSEKQILHP
jgi:hypothetical protein